MTDGSPRTAYIAYIEIREIFPPATEPNGCANGLIRLTAPRISAKSNRQIDTLYRVETRTPLSSKRTFNAFPCGQQRSFPLKYVRSKYPRTHIFGRCCAVAPDSPCASVA